MNTHKSYVSHSKSPASVVNFESMSNKNTSKIVQKIYNSIYPNRNCNSPIKSDISSFKHKLQEREQQISMSPIPLKYYRDPKKTLKLKETLQKQGKISHNSLTRPKTHHKVFSQQFSNHSESPSPSLLPIHTIFNVKKRKNTKKNFHCEALNQLASYCESSLNTPIQRFETEKREIKKNNQELKWVTETIQHYDKYESNIQNALVRYSNDSRLDLDQERAKIVGQIKSGNFDPNKTTVKLKTRIKRKYEDF